MQFEKRFDTTEKKSDKRQLIKGQPLRFLLNVPSSNLAVVCKTAVQTIYANLKAKRLCQVTLLFLETEGLQHY